MGRRMPTGNNDDNEEEDKAEDEANMVIDEDELNQQRQ